MGDAERGLRRLQDGGRDCRAVNFFGPTLAGRVVESVQSLGEKSILPLGHRRTRDPEAARHRRGAYSFGDGEHHFGTNRQTHSHR